MAIVSSREDLKQYCLRRLGYPVVEINVDDEQLEDRLDDAIQYLTEYHFDGVEPQYLKHQVTQTDIDNGYLDMDQVDSRVVSVVRAFQFGAGQNNSGNLFSVKYQIALNDFYGLRNPVSIHNYDITKRHLALLEDILTPEKHVRFNRVTNRLYLDMNWDEEINVGEYLMFEAYVAVDPETFKEFYKDHVLKRYATAKIKHQWGTNLSKFEGLQLPGGVQFNGREIASEAQQEIDKIEEEIQLKYELPPDFCVG